MSPWKLAAALGAALGLAAIGQGCTTEAFCFDCADGGATGGKSSSSTTTGSGGSGGTGGLPATCAVDKDCGAGLSCCNNQCVDTKTTVAHCGSCGNFCSDQTNAASVCVAGQCALSCTPGYADCDLLIGNGCEVDTAEDPQNCSACGQVCLFANAEPGCAMGKCTIAMCNPSFDDCNKQIDDGCEANLGTDPANCTMCGKACATLPNSTAQCLAGDCALGPCITGFDDCNLDPVDGCEINLLTDVTHCGNCATVCQPLPHTTSACTGGACGVGTCDLGYADCDLSVWSGCEAVLDTDVNNCSMCGKTCALVPHGYPKCEGGACAIGGCDAGYADCNGDPVDGCEVNLANDAANCGACTNACASVANGKPICSGFACGLGTCNAGFADCFGGAVDGCETDLTSDVDHCNTCGTVCPQIAHGSRSCMASACGIASCAMGYDDCNKLVADGCERDLNTDVNNCGMCGNICPTPAGGTAGCAAGMCTLAGCNAGFSNCDGNPANGCEFDTTVDANNCGGCGITCGSGMCAASKCVCTKTVLLIADDSPTGSATLAAAITAAGYVVTQTAVPSYQYTGSNPSPNGFGAIVILAGGPLGSSFQTDMPAAGQTAIVNFVNAGNGLVLTEWAAYQVANNRWQTLAPLVLLNRTAAYSGQVTYGVDPAFASHPVWAGLPASFTIASTSNVGITKVASGVTRIASSAQAIDAVAIRDVPKGRVVEVAHAGNYAPNGWTNANMQLLMSNSVGWAARCK
jgi:hypothetical protein